MPGAVTVITRQRMEDLASVAGVSHQTVSRVLNDFPAIRPEARARVLAAIEELGYRRKEAAHTLAVAVAVAEPVNSSILSIPYWPAIGRD